MGNVQHKGKKDGLSRFQKRKLKYEFNTFFGRMFFLLCTFVSVYKSLSKSTLIL